MASHLQVRMMESISTSMGMELKNDSPGQRAVPTMRGSCSITVTTARSTMAVNSSATTHRKQSRPLAYLQTASSLSVNTTNLQTAETQMVLSAKQTRSFHACVCGKTKITTASL